jgi:hypothetical protein
MTATTTKKPGLQNTVTRAEALSAGATKHFPNASQSLTFGGATHTVTEVTTNLGQIVTLRTATTDAQATAKAKVAAETTQLPPLLLFMAAFVAFVKATFGNQPDVLADFGLPPKKARTPLTVEQKAAAAAKRKATREARGTKGPVAKQAIVGNVIGVTVTPITTPAAPAEPAAPSTPSAPTPGTTTGTTAPHTA